MEKTVLKGLHLTAFSNMSTVDSPKNSFTLGINTQINPYKFSFTKLVN